MGGGVSPSYVSAVRTPPFCIDHLKVFKSKDVQDADALEVVFALNLLVDLQNDPRETLRVQRHGHRVPGVHGLRQKKKKGMTQREVSTGLPRVTRGEAGLAVPLKLCCVLRVARALLSVFTTGHGV